MAPSVTCACSAAIVVVAVRRVAAWPSMNSPSVRCCSSVTGSRPVPSGFRRRPLPHDPQPPQVQPLQFLPHRARLDPALREPVAGRLEGLGVRGGRAPGGVAGRGVQQHGVRALHRRPLEARPDGARRHGLLGEQVGGAHEYADPGSPGGQGSPGGHRHRGGPLVVDAAREQHVQGFGFGAGEQPFDLLLPQREGGARPDVAAALEPLEDESARALGEVALQQAGEGTCRWVRIPAASSGAACAGVPPAMIAYGGRASVTAASCSRRSSGGAKPSSPTPQGRSPSRPAVSASEKPAYVGALHDREREVRDPARGGHRRGEGGLVAHPCHRALRHGVRPPERPGPYRRFQVPGDGRPYGLQDAAGGPVAGGQPGRRSPVLPDGQQLGPQVAGAEQGGYGPLGRGQVGPCEHPVPVGRPGLGAVHRTQRGGDFLRQPGLALRGQGQLYVEQYPRGPARDGRGRRVRADPAAGPYGDPDRGVAEELLEQDEGGRRAHPAGCPRGPWPPVRPPRRPRPSWPRPLR